MNDALLQIYYSLVWPLPGIVISTGNLQPTSVLKFLFSACRIIKVTYPTETWQCYKQIK